VNSTRKPPRSRKELTLEADIETSRWLGNYNEAMERGDTKKAHKCEARAQKWLDRYNKLAGNF
jgi:hypothetical protein